MLNSARQVSVGFFFPFLFCCGGKDLFVDGWPVQKHTESERDPRTPYEERKRPTTRERDLRRERDQRRERDLSSPSLTYMRPHSILWKPSTQKQKTNQATHPAHTCAHTQYASDTNYFKQEKKKDLSNPSRTYMGPYSACVRHEASRSVLEKEKNSRERKKKT